LIRKAIFIFTIFILILKQAYGKEITIYSASDLVYAFSEIKKIYEKKYPQDKLRIIFGSSGKGYHQALNGAPFDIIFSANMKYVELLKQKGIAISDVVPYAYGKIGIWTRKDSNIDLSRGIEVVLSPDVKKIAIANWEHAPYGAASKECLEHYKLFKEVKKKFVIGENISQTAQFAEIGAADIGFIAYSLAKSEKLEKKGKFYLLPDSCHKPIKQGMAILKHSQQNKGKYQTALRFFNFMQTEKVRKIMAKYGFALKDKEK
jgi:molybdate transport system substrate-binding protein